MKFTMEIDSELNPDAVGEFLRSSFFDEKDREAEWGGYRDTGCYTTFDWREDVEELPQERVWSDQKLLADVGSEALIADCDRQLMWIRGRKNQIECRWYWDGDGTLAFHLPDGKWLVNHDCKKDHDWNLVDREEDL